MVCRTGLFALFGVVEEVVGDELWARLEPLIPLRQRRFRNPGRRTTSDRAALEGILFVARTGIGWNRFAVASDAPDVGLRRPALSSAAGSECSMLGWPRSGSALLLEDFQHPPSQNRSGVWVLAGDEVTVLDHVGLPDGAAAVVDLDLLFQVRLQQPRGP
ncbi:hypothetical protein C8259_29790 [Nocardia nova]|uniref:Insertion element IS402-like domain-containing protein n=1 Tax=Nocardia nova TaxID=37330 RepID=A0A2T2YTB1_9NOCA|nr:hypothetical protein C8259_29790 [Nocardia nova]